MEDIVAALAEAKARKAAILGSKRHYYWTVDTGPRCHSKSKVLPFHFNSLFVCLFVCFCLVVFFYHSEKSAHQSYVSFSVICVLYAKFAFR